MTERDNNVLLTANNLLPESMRAASAGLDLECRRGDIAVLTGINASITTAFLRTLAGRYPPARGTLDIAVAKPGGDRPATGYIDLRAPLVSTFDVRMNVMLPRLYHLGEPHAEAKRVADDLLQRFGYQDPPDEVPARLDSLQQLQALLARGLALDPAIVFIDEPFPIEIAAHWQSIAASIRSIARDDGRAVIVATQNLAFAKMHADTIVLIDSDSTHRYSGWRDFHEAPHSQEFIARLPFDGGERHATA